MNLSEREKVFMQVMTKFEAIDFYFHGMSMAMFIKRNLTSHRLSFREDKEKSNDNMV